MSEQPERADFDALTRELIRSIAWRMVGRAGLSAADVEDLEQELVLRLLQRISAYRPGRGKRAAFVTTVLRHLSSNLLRDRGAGRRDYRRHARATGEHGAAATFGEGVEDTAPAARRGRCRRGAEELADLVADLGDVLAGLPPDLRELAERLKVESVAGAARALGIARTTVYTSLRRLRKHFEQVGLQHYL
ncbi:MAG TPA: sigma-70 family RNA polymerase sigma factor [Gemmataceae bacterium]